MNVRVLSREEHEWLSSEAARLAYRYIHSHYCTPDVIEKALMQAVIIAQMNQSVMDAGTLSLLVERISEFEGVSHFDPEKGEMDAAHRYC